MREDFLLLNPGPVPVAHEVRKAMDQPMISRRSREFGEVYDRVREGLEYVYEHSTRDGARSPATGEGLLLNGTATMALEAGVANLAGGGSVVVLDNGSFGNRLTKIAGLYADVTSVRVNWGSSIDLDAVEREVTEETDLVAMVHNETSTGLTNPVAPVGEIAAEHNAQFLVDGVSSIGGGEFRFDEWNIDIAVTDPQKALASPPGISILYASQSAIESFDRDHSSLYLNLEDHITAASDSRTPYTSASPLIRALDVALKRIREEGMQARIERHDRYANAVRKGMKAMGLKLYPTPENGATYSNTLTAVTIPDAVDAETFFQELHLRGVSVGGGIQQLEGLLFRFSNMGELSPDQIIRGVYSVGKAIEQAGADDSISVRAGADAVETSIRR